MKRLICKDEQRLLHSAPVCNFSTSTGITPKSDLFTNYTWNMIGHQCDHEVGQIDLDVNIVISPNIEVGQLDLVYEYWQNTCKMH